MHAGMAVGNADDFQEALQAPSSPGGPCNTLSTTSGLRSVKLAGDVAGDVDAGDAVAGAFGGIGAGLAGVQRDFALGRPAAHQDRDVFLARFPGANSNT